MVGKNIHDHSFQKKDQVVTLASKRAVRFSEGSIQVDPQLLYQRLTVVATEGRYDKPQTFFKFEMCSYPPAGICSLHVQYVANRYGKATVVFDGYQNGPSTKDVTHQ